MTQIVFKILLTVQIIVMRTIYVSKQLSPSGPISTSLYPANERISPLRSANQPAPSYIKRETPAAEASLDQQLSGRQQLS